MNDFQSESPAIGIFAFPWDKETGGSTKRWRSPVCLYKKAVQYKVNPRTEAYMEELFIEKYPHGRFINISEDKEWVKKILRDDTIVLLYPDAIGIGFLWIEIKILLNKARKTSMYVLNGRKRRFVLQPVTYINLVVRRILEKLMIGEICAVLLFIVITPFLLIRDWVRGRF